MNFMFFSSNKHIFEPQPKHFQQIILIIILFTWQTMLFKNILKIMVHFKMVISYLSGNWRNFYQKMKFTTFGIELNKLLIWLLVQSKRKLIVIKENIVFNFLDLILSLMLNLKHGLFKSIKIHVFNVLALFLLNSFQDWSMMLWS